MRILITGGVGALGTPICKTFLGDGFTVRVLIRDRKANRRKAAILGSNVETALGDVTDPDTVRQAMQGVDAVVHLAGVVRPESERNPERADRVNLGGTRAIIDTIKDSGGNIPFLFASSVAVFGPTPGAADPLSPDRSRCNPTDIYARTKAQAETWIKESGIDYLIMRLTAVPHFAISLRQMKAFMFSIPLKNRVEFCHPEDVALAMINAVKRFDHVKGKTLIIAGGPGQQMYYEDLLRGVLGVFGLPLPPDHRFTTDPYDLDWYDTRESQELLNYQQRTLDDYSRDLARQFPSFAIALMQRVVGPALGKLIVRLI
jgi:nucleoside-diphosphate-sugar epimerase